MNVTQAVKSAALLILMAASLPALGDSKMFLVDMKILQDGAELATPSMLIKEGADASMSLTGEQPVALALTVTGAGESDAHILAEVETALGQMSPELLMRKDQWGSVSTGGLEFHIRVQDHIEGQSQP
ncbi:MAG: hypothetical protein GVY11_04545 [Gammaproteobacteria bacterium]|jgi:hypothetical protein|nr:hypothetical protein [Gammaproteobacteria bacterium]